MPMPMGMVDSLLDQKDLDPAKIHHREDQHRQWCAVLAMITRRPVVLSEIHDCLCSFKQRL
jgi:hypothetical protein